MDLFKHIMVCWYIYYYLKYKDKMIILVINHKNSNTWTNNIVLFGNNFN